MDKHYGQVVEYIVRKKGISITDLANGLNVNRRTVYKCFDNKYLKAQVIQKIGIIIKHDFSKEFSELFTADEFSSMHPDKFKPSFVLNNEHWKKKYLELLEKHNGILINNNTLS